MPTPIKATPPAAAAAAAPKHLPLLHPAHAYWWLHPPKTGSSFRNTLLELPWSKDRDTSWPQGNHQVLFPDIAGRIDTPGVRVVAFFRQPEERLVSSYFHMRDLIIPAKRASYIKSLGSPIDCCWTDWGWPTSAYRPVHRNVANGVPPEQSGIAQFWGCQTSMILGKGCMSRYANSPSHVAQAIALVEKFEFVGELKHWNLSICLFNAIVTGRRHTLSYQLINTRPTSSKKLKARRAAARSAAAGASSSGEPPQPAADPSLSRINTTDPIDGALYAYASYRFWHDVRRYGVSKECCPNYDSIDQMPPKSAEPPSCLVRPPPPPSSSGNSKAVAARHFNAANRNVAPAARAGRRAARNFG